MDTTIQNFMAALSSNKPVPGGGGASALIGSVGVALCSMVSNLTTGKKKYEEFQEDMEDILVRTEASMEQLLELIEKDAKVFEPLAEAYSIPKDSPGRAVTLETALVNACTVPMEILKEVYGVVDMVEQLAVKGSKLAISDIGVAASACRSAMEGAAMNVYINTKLMQDKEYAQKINLEAEKLLKEGVNRCDKVYQRIAEELRGVACRN